MKALTVISAVAAGGIVGALMRLAVQEAAKRTFSPAWHVLGTTTVNLTGCFAAGLLGTLAARLEGPAPVWSRFMITGILGSFTTFSALAWESTDLAKTGRSSAGVFHMATNVGGGVVLVWLGMRIADLCWPQLRTIR